MNNFNYTWDQYKKYCSSNGKTAIYDRWLMLKNGKMSKTYSKKSMNMNDKPNKHTGCEIKQTKNKKGDDITCVIAWNASKSRGMTKIIGSSYDTYETKEGSTGSIWCLKFTNMKTFTDTLHTGFQKSGSKKIVVPSIGWVLNPTAKRGGYCGTFTEK
jgi:hypothetical protein